MDKPQPQYHISDITWRRIQPHLPGQKGQWGGIARDNRLFIDAVLWVLRTGAPWRKLPKDARQAPPVFRERFGPGHGKRHFPAGTAT